MRMLCTLVTAAGLALGGQCLGQSPQGPHTTAGACNDPVHRQFDFWLGDWQVFDGQTGQLVAFDRIDKELNGCVMVQHLVWLSDEFRKPELPYRPSGMSWSVVQDGHWLMLWADTYSGTVLAEGELQKDGSMLLETPKPVNGEYTRGVWQRHGWDRP